MNYLRRALRILGYTNHTLANELTQIRIDGASTSLATVSRWISGAANPDPGVLLYLREKLRQRASMMQPKLSRCVVVGVNGFKGGCGNSLLSNLLAVWATTLRLKVAHIVAHQNCQNSFHRDFPEHAGLTFGNGEDGLASLALGDLDLVFIDLPRDAFAGYDGNTYQPLENLLVDKLDVLISPTNIGSTLHLDPLTRAYQSMDERGLSFIRQIVACSNDIYISNITKCLAMVAPWREQLYPQTIHLPQRPNAIRCDFGYGFPRLIIDTDINNALESLMSPLIESVTGDSLDTGSPLLGDKNDLQIPELVELLDPA